MITERLIYLDQSCLHVLASLEKPVDWKLGCQ